MPQNNKIHTASMMSYWKRNMDDVDVLLNANKPHIPVWGRLIHRMKKKSARVNPNKVDVDGNTCLHDAVVGNCSKEVLQVIIDQGVDVNETNMENVTALMIACENNDLYAIHVLLNAGADPNIIDSMGDTCLHAAVHAGCQKEVVPAIIDHGADLNITDQHKQTALVLACCLGNLDILNIILHYKADPNIADIDGDTLLHIAVQKNINKEILQLIIDYGADVNAVNNDSETALLLACSAKQRESVSMLLKAGADTSIVDVHGDTCLHKILHREFDQEALQQLLDYGVPVNATNRNHQTAYMLACKQGNVDAICALMNAGSDMLFRF